MSHDFELRRIKDKIKELHKEQERTTHLIVKSRRDEQFDLDRIRREYDIRIKTMETKQQERLKELEKLERELEHLNKVISDEEKEDEENNKYQSHKLR